MKNSLLLASTIIPCCPSLGLEEGHAKRELHETRERLGPGLHAGKDLETTIAGGGYSRLSSWNILCLAELTRNPYNLRK